MSVPEHESAFWSNEIVGPSKLLGITMLNFPLLNETKALLPEVILTPLLPEYEKVGREVGEGVVTQVTLITPLDIEMLENC